MRSIVGPPWTSKATRAHAVAASTSAPTKPSRPKTKTRPGGRAWNDDQRSLEDDADAARKVENHERERLLLWRHRQRRAAAVRVGRLAGERSTRDVHVREHDFAALLIGTHIQRRRELEVLRL